LSGQDPLFHVSLNLITALQSKNLILYYL